MCEIFVDDISIDHSFSTVSFELNAVAPMPVESGKRVFMWSTQTIYVIIAVWPSSDATKKKEEMYTIMQLLAYLCCRLVQ